MGTEEAGEPDETGAVGERQETKVTRDEDETEVTEEGPDVGGAPVEPEGTSPPVTTEPGTNNRTGDADAILEGWVAGDYHKDGRVAGTWVHVDSVEAGDVDDPGLPHYDCWGGCYIPVVAADCPLPEIGALEVVRVSGRNVDDGFGIDVCVPGGSMAPTGRTAEGDPADFVHFLAIYGQKDLYNRESTILATLVEVFSGSPDYFSDVVRIRDKESSFWEPTGRSFEEGMSLEVFGWFDAPVATGRPFAVFRAAFMIWDR
jgi:hypothetical protein